MAKYHTIKKCLECKFCEVGRRKPKYSPTVITRDLYAIIIMCGAVGKYQLVTKNQMANDEIAFPSYCPLPETEDEDGLVPALIA